MAEELEVERLQHLQDVMKQLRGTCAMAGLGSLSRLSQEIIASIDAGMADKVDREELRVLLVSSLTAASKLAKAIVETRRDNVCVLLPEMTALRRLRGEPPLYEYHCLTNVVWPEFDEQVASNPLAGEQKDDVKRLLHLYQFGLLDIIRGNNRGKAFIILYRVAQRLQNIAVLAYEKDYWWLVGLVVRAFAEERLELQVERIRLLAALEKQLRLLAAENPGSGRNPYPEGLWRAFVSLVALLEPKDSDELERRERIGIPKLGFTEQEISAIRKEIIEDVGGEGRKIFRSLKDLIWNTRYLLDTPENGLAGDNSAAIKELQKAFDTMASLWAETGFQGLSRIFKQFSQRLQMSNPESEFSEEMMVEFIDAILQSECALLEFNYVPPSKGQAKQWESRPLTEILQVSLLKSAQVAVMAELGLHLGEIKEILNEVSMGYSNEEILPELETALLVISSSAALIRFDRLAKLASRCLTFVKETLFSTQTDQLVANYWEVFADSITCLEYYIDNCKSGYQEDEAALDIADECLSSLGVS